jgi:N-acyl-phosphatidylethanolamine-hydrolysing phospholipase D
MRVGAGTRRVGVRSGLSTPTLSSKRVDDGEIACSDQFAHTIELAEEMTNHDTPARVATDTTASAAHRAPDGSFRNPWPDSTPPEWRDVLRWMSERRLQSRAETERRGRFPVATPAISYPRASDADFAATWIGHSTVLLQLGGLNVLTDPVFSQRASPLQWLGPRRVMDPGLPLDALPPLDVVLLSHNHYDHLDKSVVKRIASVNPRTTWIVPLGLGGYIRGWGAREIVELDWWQQAVIGGLRVTATPARHFSGRRLSDRNQSLWCGFAFETGGKRAYFAGDTAYHPDFVEIGERYGPFDLAMIPIGAYDPRWFMHRVHVDPEEAVHIYQDLVAPHAGKPLPLMLAIHWGTFRLTDEPMDEPPRRTVLRWRALGLEEDRLWIASFGETRLLAG